MLRLLAAVPFLAAAGAAFLYSSMRRAKREAGSDGGA